MKATMEPLLNAAGVDIVLAGHVHAYERTVCRSELTLFPHLRIDLQCLAEIVVMYSTETCLWWKN